MCIKLWKVDHVAFVHHRVRRARRAPTPAPRNDDAYMFAARTTSVVHLYVDDSTKSELSPPALDQRAWLHEQEALNDRLHRDYVRRRGQVQRISLRYLPHAAA